MRHGIMSGTFCIEAECCAQLVAELQPLPSMPNVWECCQIVTVVTLEICSDGWDSSPAALR